MMPAELSPIRERRLVSYLTLMLPSMMAISSGNFFATEDTETTEFLVSFVFLANFAPKASFVTNLCLRPQGHQNGLLMKLAKRV